MKRKKNILLIIIVFELLTTNLISQKIRVADLSLKDSAAVTKNISVIANRALDVFTSNSKPDLYDGLFRLQIVAGKYESALSSIDTMLSTLGSQSIINWRQFGFPYEVFCRSQMQLKFSGALPTSVFDSVAAAV